MEREILKGNTPVLILAILQGGPLHGYGIAREIESQSGRILKLNEGSLYPTLHTLERDGLVAGEWRSEGEERRRKVYTLTARGHAALAKRARTWKQFSSAIDKILTGGPHDKDQAEKPRSGRADPRLSTEPSG